MRNIQRIRMRCVLLFFLAAISVLVVCIEELSAKENGNAQIEYTNFGDMTPMGWYAPDLEDLWETTWSTYQDLDEGERTIYYLDLYGGEQADYGEYDGEACFAWLYDNDEDCQEYYEGWWSLEEVDGQACLCLDICRIGGLMYREGEEPKVISNQFPVLCDTERLSMILHKGLRIGKSLPFLNEQTTFEFLTQSVGNPAQDIGASGTTEMKPRENTSPETENQRDTENCVRVQWAKDVLTNLSDYERFRLGLDEEPPLIYVSTKQTIKEFKELSLIFESVDDNGNVNFAVEETYSHGTLTPEAPLLVRMELIGTIPNNGISYVDSSGKTRYFAVEVSGYDGSLLLSEFEPQM